MNFAEKIWKNWQQPQLFTLFIIVFLVLIISIILYFQIKKTKKDKAPSTIVYLAEQYFTMVDNLVTESSEGKLNKIKPYIFTLFSFLLIGNLVSIIGLEPVGSTISVTLTLAIISWTGTFVVGFIFQKFWFFKKFINPLEIISMPAPLISLSFRLFGNIIGGSTMLLLLFSLFKWIWGLVVPQAWGEILNLPAIVLMPPFIFYFDIFDTLIQSYVFTLLTTMYWSNEAETIEKKKKNKSKSQLDKKMLQA